MKRGAATTRSGPAPAKRARAAAAAAEVGLEPSLRELRSAVANLRAAAEALAAATPGIRGARNAALLSAVIEEAERASRAVDELAARANQPRGGREVARSIPARQLAADLSRRSAAELELVVQICGPIAESLTVAPTFVSSILGVLGHLRHDFGIGEVELSARRHVDLLALEIAFSAREPESSRLREQHAHVLAGGFRGEPALADQARAAGGEAWLAIRRGEATFSLRLLLPLAVAA